MSEDECGEGSSCSSYTGGGIIETCIIHFPNVNASNTIVSLSNIEHPSELLEKLIDMQTQTLRTTRFCSKNDRYLFQSTFYIF